MIDAILFHQIAIKLKTVDRPYDASVLPSKTNSLMVAMPIALNWNL